MRSYTSTCLRYLRLAAIVAFLGLPLVSPGQNEDIQALGQLLSESVQIGDPFGAAAPPNLWVRSDALLRLSADGFVVFQKGHRLRSLDRSNFDPTAPFCVVDVETAVHSTRTPDPEMEAGEQRRASVVPIRDNPVDLGQYHLSTDLLLVVAQGDPWTIQFGFMWPHEAGSPAPARRSATIADLHAIVGPEFDFGSGAIARTAYATFRVTTFNLSFEVLVLDETRTNARTDIQPHQFNVYEGCVPVLGLSCDPVEPLTVDSAATTGGGVNFIVLPEIAGEASHRTIIRDAVGRLADFTRPQDRLAIVPYYERPTIWQQLTGDKDAYRARAISLFDADVGARVGYINTRRAVATALTEVADKVEAQPAASPAGFPLRNVILVITEGHDCFNAYEIAKMAAEHNSSIWVLDLTGRNQVELKPLAEMSGGFYFRVDGYADLLAHMEKFVQMWNRVYLISYQSSPPDQEGKQPRREIRVTRAGGTDLDEVSLIVSKGLHGPQVVANMFNLETYYMASAKPFSEAQTISDLFPFVHKINSDSDFPGFVLKAILLARSPGEFVGFLDRIEHIVTPKRRKTIGHLITAKLEAFRSMKPEADDWIRLRSWVGNVEDWKQVTEAFLTELNTPDAFLRAMTIDEAPGASEYTEQVRAMLPAIALAHLSRFASLMPSDRQKDSLLALLPNENQKMQARRAFGIPLARVAPEITRIFQESSDSARGLSFLQGLLCSAPNPGEFAEIVNLYRGAGPPNSEAVASDSVLSCLKNLASFSSPQATIPIVLQSVLGCRGRLAAARELKASISQINLLKEETADENCLLSLYLLGVRQAHSNEELAAALSIPKTGGPIDYEKLRDGLIEALLPEFRREARPAAEYLVLADKARAIGLRIAVLNAGLSVAVDAAIKQELKSSLDQLQGVRAK